LSYYRSPLIPILEYARSQARLAALDVQSGLLTSPYHSKVKGCAPSAFPTRSSPDRLFRAAAHVPMLLMAEAREAVADSSHKTRRKGYEEVLTVPII